MLAAWPPLMPLVEPILGAPYARFRCWDLAAYLLKQGWDIDLSQEDTTLNSQVAQVWFRGDARPLPQLLQPWDFLVLTAESLVGDHCAVVCDPVTIVHTRRTAGVVTDRLRPWIPKVLQVARLRRLL